MVYIITTGDYSAYHICAVTLDKKRAEKLKKLYGCIYGYEDVNIEEYQEDDMSDFTDKQLSNEPIKYYHVQISKNGRFSSFVNECYMFGDKQIEQHGRFGIDYHRGNGINTDVYIVDVIAEDEDYAKKIAQDKYTQALAEYYNLT